MAKPETVLSGTENTVLSGAENTVLSGAENTETGNNHPQTHSETQAT